MATTYSLYIQQGAHLEPGKTIVFEEGRNAESARTTKNKRVKSMAHSRLERIGTIYTRITSLIRTGAMKLDERPLWYEVYQAFPPATPPRYDNPAPAGEIRKIFYPEDVIRAKYYSAIRSAPAISLLEDGRPSHCRVFLDNCKRLSSEKGVAVDDVFDEALSLTRQALAAQTEPSDSRLVKAPASVRPVQEKSSVNMKSVLSDDAVPPSQSKTD